MKAATSPVSAAPLRVKKPRSSNLTHEQKRQICLHAKRNPTLTQAQLGEWAKDQFALVSTPSQSSISHMLKRKHNFEHMKSDELASKRMRSVKFPELDTALANWFLYCQAKQIKIQGDEIKAKAQSFFDKMGIATSDPPQFSNGWLHSFQSRHGFSRSPNAHGHSSDDTSMVITTKEQLALAIQGVAPWDLYWMDETRLFYDMAPDRSLMDFQPQHQMTIAFCTNADATDMPTPFFVCETALPIEAKNDTSKIEHGFRYVSNNKAWLTPMLFREWLLALDWRVHEENRHIVLLLDTYSSHQVKKMALKNVTIRFVRDLSSNLAMTSNSSSCESCITELETSIITAVKRRYRHVYLNHVLDRKDDRQTDIYEVELMQAIQWVIQSWRQLPKALIMESFARIGVPMDGDIVSTASVEEKLDAQILALLKRLKLKSPMKLSELLFPAAERVVDEELSDQDFVDSAANAMPGKTVVGYTNNNSKSEGRQQRARRAVPAKSTQPVVNVQHHTLMAPSRTIPTNTIVSTSSFDPSSTTDQAIGVSEDEWQAWAEAQRPHSSDELQALQTVIRLATEMDCEPSTILDLNRMQEELTHGRHLPVAAVDGGGAAKEEGLTQYSGVCRFTFGTSSKRTIV